MNFGTKTFKKKTITGGLVWRLTVLTTPFCNQVLLGRFLWNTKVHQFWPPFDHLLNLDTPNKTHPMFRGKIFGDDAGFVSWLQSWKTEHRPVRNGSCLLPNPNTKCMVYLPIIYHTNQLNVGLNISCIEHLGNGCSTFLSQTFSHRNEVYIA